MRRHFKNNIKRGIAAARIFSEREQLPEIPHEELYQKITCAAAEVGIEEVVVIAMDSRNRGSRNTHGFARPRKYYDGKPNQNPCRDLGYIELDQNKITIDSFSINYTAFSDAKGEEFRTALIAAGLRPKAYIPAAAPPFYTDGEMARDKVKNEKATYR